MRVAGHWFFLFGTMVWSTSPPWWRSGWQPRPSGSLNTPLPQSSDLAKADFFLSPIIKKQLACKTLTPESFKFTREGTARNIAKGDFATAFRRGYEQCEKWMHIGSRYIKESWKINDWKTQTVFERNVLRKLRVHTTCMYSICITRYWIVHCTDFAHNEILILWEFFLPVLMGLFLKLHIVSYFLIGGFFTFCVVAKLWPKTWQKKG